MNNSTLSGFYVAAAANSDKNLRMRFDEVVSRLIVTQAENVNS